MPRKPDLSLIGKTFNDLEVLEYTDQRNSYGRGLYLCRCKLCGGTRLATKANLVRGEIKNCGCKRHTLKNDLTGQTVGDLYVMGTVVIDGHVKYRCRCMYKGCGAIILVIPQSLTDGSTLRCDRHHGDFIKELYAEGTAPCKLTESKKPRSTNTSGVTGVWFDKKRNLWCAEIMFKRHKYHLGRRADKADAIALRKRAEKEIFGNFLEWYYEVNPPKKPKK